MELHFVLTPKDFSYSTKSNNKVFWDSLFPLSNEELTLPCLLFKNHSENAAFMALFELLFKTTISSKTYVLLDVYITHIFSRTKINWVVG